MASLVYIASLSYTPNCNVGCSSTFSCSQWCGCSFQVASSCIVVDKLLHAQGLGRSTCTVVRRTSSFVVWCRWGGICLPVERHRARQSVVLACWQLHCRESVCMNTKDCGSICVTAWYSNNVFICPYTRLIVKVRTTFVSTFFACTSGTHVGVGVLSHQAQERSATQAHNNPACRM